MTINDRFAELEAQLARCTDPRGQEQLEVQIAELAQDLDDPTPTDAQLDEWAMQGEDRMLAGMGWGRDDC